MKEELLQIKQDITDISNDLKTNLADKGVTADGTLSELVDRVPDIESNVLGEIGWNLSEQSYLNDAIEYAKEILKNPKSTYQNDKQLVIFPKVDELELKSSMFKGSNLTLFPEGVRLTGSGNSIFFQTNLGYIDLSNSSFDKTYYLFYECRSLNTVDLPTNFGKGITDMRNMFYMCLKLSGSITIDISDCTDVSYMFQGCSSLQSLDITGTVKDALQTNNCFYGMSNLTYLSVPDNFPFYPQILSGVSIPKIYGSFDYSKYTVGNTSPYYWFWAYTINSINRYIVVKNLGYNSKQEGINMSYSRVWGIDSDEVPDARQSLIDSLITYSFDRASAGYSTMTWTLYSDVKALLTDDEIAQITAKGYTLV